MKSIVSSKVMALGAAVLLCLIINCSSAPVIESSAVLANSFEGEVDSAEVETAGDHRREGRFLKDIFNSIPPFTGGGYYPNPYYYSGYNVPVKYYYQPVFQYRQARRKKHKRLFVPNFWG